MRPMWLFYDLAYNFLSLSSDALKKQRQIKSMYVCVCADNFKKDNICKLSVVGGR